MLPVFDELKLHVGLITERRWDTSRLCLRSSSSLLTETVAPGVRISGDAPFIELASLGTPNRFLGVGVDPAWLERTFEAIHTPPAINAGSVKRYCRI